MPDMGFADPGLNSFNHAAFGCVATWLDERLAGLAPGRPGWELMRFRPRPAGGIEWAEAAHASRPGRHAVRWATEARRLEVVLEVPPNAFAKVLFEEGTRQLRVDGRARVAARPIVVGWRRHVVEGVR